MRWLALLLALLPALALGQSSPNWPLGYFPTMPEWNAEFAKKQDASSTLPVINALAYGVVPDGKTSNDQALGLALYACTQANGRLILPPGKILLTGASLTGNATRILKNCAIQGTGAPGTTGTNIQSGTTFLMTSTDATKPSFIGNLGWSMQDFNVYWPGQTTGSSFYPPFMTDDGVNPNAHARVDNVNLINAYDGFVQNNTAWGDIKFSNSTMYAVNDLFRFNYTGDSFVLTGMRFTPGPWETYCNFSSPCNTAISVAANQNTILHAQNAGGPGGVSFVMKGIETFAWRYGIKTETGALVTESQFDVSWDTVGTIVDSSAGGTYSFANIMTGSSAGCNLLTSTGGHTGSPTCFNLGVLGELDLTSFQGTSNGSFIVTAGANVRVWDSVGVFGFAGGSADFYAVQATANSGGTNVNIQNSRFSGQAGSTHDHGISTSIQLSNLLIRNNDFENLNDDITVTTASGLTTVIGNTSFGTQSPASVVISGTGGVTWGLNHFDKMPPGAGTAAQVSNCGSGATIFGSMSGVINVGSTNPTISCTLTLPWVPAGISGGACQPRTAGGIALSAGPVGTPPVYTITSYSVDMHGTQIFFNCPGEQ